VCVGASKFMHVWASCPLGRLHAAMTRTELPADEAIVVRVAVGGDERAPPVDAHTEVPQVGLGPTATQHMRMPPRPPLDARTIASGGK
jgi:hypothetical protein